MTGRRFYAATGLAAASLVAGLALAQPPTQTDSPAWTGVTHVEDIVAARFGLMVETERLMQPIDSYTIGEPADPEALRSAATTISYLLKALPHLFPPPTNLYDPAAVTPVTIALPAIWDDFETFYTLADNSARSAARMATTTDTEALRTAALQLRASCDACHAVYLRAYVGPEVSTEDAEFDFDSVFQAE